MNQPEQTNWGLKSFEGRQAEWTGFPRTFIQNNGRGKKPTVWTIRVDGDTVTVVWGQTDGAKQTTSFKGKEKNKGRSNAITAAQDALAEARRQVRKRFDFEGFDEVWQGQNIDRRNEDLSIAHLLTNLPGSFCLYKPENNFWDQKKLVEKARAGKVWYTVKRDGMAKLVVVDYYGAIQMYSRRARPYHKDEGPQERADGMLDYTGVIPWATRFHHLIDAVRGLKLPGGSMIAGELVYPRNAGDDFKHVQSITKSLTPQAMKDMQEKGHPFFYWWDMPFFAGEDWVSKKYVLHRFTHMRQIWEAAPPEVQSWIIPIQIEQFPSPEDALARAREMGIEGWVVVDPESIYGSKGWNVKGKPDRPATCAKLKPKGEADFVAYWDPQNKVGEWGTGKHERGKLVTLPDGSQVTHGGVGSMALYQHNSKGELIYICDCASGMEYSFQARLSKNDFPMIVQIEYSERTYMSEGEKTNALRFPVFVRKRDDKSAAECVDERL